MFDFLAGHYAYWFIFILLAIGLYGIVIKKNLVKKVIGLIIFQAGVILFFIAGSAKWMATVPILDPAVGYADAAKYINPLPHTLMLTAIVVGVATSGVAFALIILIYKRFRTLHEPDLLKKLKDDTE